MKYLLLILFCEIDFGFLTNTFYIKLIMLYYSSYCNTIEKAVKCCWTAIYI